MAPPHCPNAGPAGPDHAQLAPATEHSRGPEACPDWETLPTLAEPVADNPEIGAGVAAEFHDGWPAAGWIQHSSESRVRTRPGPHDRCCRYGRSYAATSCTRDLARDSSTVSTAH